MKTLIVLCLLASAVFAQDGPVVEILAEGPLGSICTDAPPESGCSFPEKSMGWFVHVRSEDTAVVAFTAVLKYVDKDGAELEATETVVLNRELSDTAFIAIRVGPFRETGNKYTSVAVRALTELPTPVE